MTCLSTTWGGRGVEGGFWWELSSRQAGGQHGQRLKVTRLVKDSIEGHIEITFIDLTFAVICMIELTNGQN